MTETLSEQEAFNAIWERSKNKEAARDSSNDCLYRGGGTNGDLKCFVGELITDEEYDETFEGDNAFRVCREVPRLEGLGHLLSEAQGIHDDHEPERWADRLRALAAHRGLRIPE